MEQTTQPCDVPWPRLKRIGVVIRGWRLQRQTRRNARRNRLMLSELSDHRLRDIGYEQMIDQRVQHWPHLRY